MLQNQASVRVDVGFRVASPPVPLDHGYTLFGALAALLGDLHRADWLAVHPLAGRVLPGNLLSLSRHGVALRLRVTPEQIPRVLHLAGKSIDLAGRPGTPASWNRC